MATVRICDRCGVQGALSPATLATLRAVVVPLASPAGQGPVATDMQAQAALAFGGDYCKPCAASAIVEYVLAYAGLTKAQLAALAARLTA